MVSFQTKNPNLGIFWRALDCKMLIYFMAICNILQTFVIFCVHLVIFSSFGIMHQEKSGSPDFSDNSMDKVLDNFIAFIPVFSLKYLTNQTRLQYQFLLLSQCR
jgi:hypothetical protein